jgi:tight adherence protein B
MTEAMKLALLISACLLLAGFIISALLVSSAQKERQKRSARMALVVSPHLREQRPEVSAIIVASKARDWSLDGIAAAVFGFDSANQDRYPLSWWLVVCFTLVLGGGAHIALSNLLGPPSILAIPVGCVGMSRLFFSWFDQRLRGQMLVQFPDALAMIVRSVRVGIPVQEAIRSVAREAPHPTGPAFARLVSQTSVGVSMEDAMADMAQRSGLSDYRFFATALSLQSQTGGGLSEVLENLADLIRKRVALKGKAKAMTAEAKASAAILMALPVLTGLGLWAVNPTYIALLFTDTTGNTLLGTAVVSLCIGLLVIRTIINKSLPT